MKKTSQSWNALRLRTTVGQAGRVSLPKLPLTKGSTVEVIILNHDVRQDDLLAASESSLSFWNNPTDDKAWNDA